MTTTEWKKVITAIEYVNRPMVRMVAASKDIDETVAHAAWVSNFGGPHPRRPDQEDLQAWNNRLTGLINFLYREKHMSPFEHASFTFFVEAPIFVAREFFRHRTFSYNEISGRYTELPPRFYIPDENRPLIQKGKIGAYQFVPGNRAQYNVMTSQTKAVNRRAWETYQSMLSAGIAREVSRIVLPLNIMTQFYVTGNLRNWLQFLTLRTGPQALKEIREVAEAIEQRVERHAPIVYGAYKTHSQEDEILQLRARVEELENQPKEELCTSQSL